MNGARELLTNMTPRGRIGLAASVLAVLVVGFLLISWAGKPSYTLALSGLDPAQTGKITAALDEKGIKYEIRNNGTAVAVDSASTSQAQIALAEGGLSGTGSTHPGFELVTEQKLGASNFQQQVAYQQALEGQLATVIEQIQGVSRADVQLVLPEDQLFADEDGQQATASVLLGAEAGSLSSQTVRGIAGLVSSSVKGLKQENVTITDAAGTPLWPTSTAGGADVSTTKLQAEAKYARQLEQQVDALLARTLGPDKAHVQIAATLDMSEGTQESLKYGRTGVPLTTKRETERYTGQGSAQSGGATGTAANTVPTYAQGSGAGSNNSYNRSSNDTDMGVDKTITKTKIAGGNVQRMSVALLLDKSVPAAQKKELEATVSAAVGLDATRGDSIKSSQFAFAKAPAAAKPSVMAGPMVGYAKYGAIGLGALVFLLMTFRALRKAERRPLAGEPVWLREIETPRAIADLGRGDDETEVWRAPDGEMTKTRKRLESVVDEDTDRVAATVRAWMQED